MVHLLVRTFFPFVWNPKVEDSSILGCYALLGTRGSVCLTTQMKILRYLETSVIIYQSIRRYKDYCSTSPLWESHLAARKFIALCTTADTDRQLQFRSQLYTLLLSKLTENVYNRSLRYRILFHLCGPVMDGKGSFTPSITLFVEFDIAELTCVQCRTLFDSTNSSKIRCVFFYVLLTVHLDTSV